MNENLVFKTINAKLPEGWKLMKIELKTSFFGMYTVDYTILNFDLLDGIKNSFGFTSSEMDEDVLAAIVSKNFSSRYALKGGK